MNNTKDKCREAFEAEFPLADLRKDSKGRYTEPDTARLHVGFFKGFNYRLNVSRNLPFRDTLERSICTTVSDYDETLDTLAEFYNQLSEENERLGRALGGSVKAEIDELDFEKGTATFSVPDCRWAAGEYYIIPASDLEANKEGM